MLQVLGKNEIPTYLTTNLFLVWILDFTLRPPTTTYV